ncbi:MAG: hypothetical protein ACK6DP_16565 [Gemmatimonas sp.]
MPASISLSGPFSWSLPHAKASAHIVLRITIQIFRIVPVLC